MSRDPVEAIEAAVDAVKRTRAEAEYWASVQPEGAAAFAVWQSIRGGKCDRHLNVLSSAIKARQREIGDPAW